MPRPRRRNPERERPTLDTAPAAAVETSPETSGVLNAAREAKRVAEVIRELKDEQ